MFLYNWFKILPSYFPQGSEASISNNSDASAEIFGISTDSFFSHKAWADALDLKHRLLADMHRTVCKSYGLYFDALNCAKRATVIVSKDGKVAYAKVQEIKTPRDDKEILDALKKLN